MRLRTASWLLMCGVLVSGCELVVDFDRSKIPRPDAAMDARMPMDDEDAGSEDAGADAASDAAQGAAPDASGDATLDIEAGPIDDAGADDDAGDNDAG